VAVNNVFDWEEEWEWNGEGKGVDEQLDKILDRKKNININNSFADIVDFNFDLSVNTIQKIREGRS